MIPIEVATIAEALRENVPIIGFDRSVRWAWHVYHHLLRTGWMIVSDPSHAPPDPTSLAALRERVEALEAEIGPETYRDILLREAARAKRNRPRFSAVLLAQAGDQRT